MDKECQKCGIVKPEQEFSIKDKVTGRRQTTCKTCHSEYRKDHYLRNKSKYIEKAKVNRDKDRQKIRQIILDAKIQCVRCGEDDEACLDFHHKQGEDKKFTIGSTGRSTYGSSAVLAEIDKCLVLCSNCHRKLHRGRWSLDEL